MIVLSQMSACDAYFWGVKKKTVFEKFVEFGQDIYRKSYEKSYNFLISEYVATLRAIILLAICYGAYRLIKGRHRTPKDSVAQSLDNKTDAASRSDAGNATTVNVHNVNVQYDALNAAPKDRARRAKKLE